MKKFSFLLLSVLLLTSCGKKAEITILNNSEVDRNNEFVDICLCQLSGLDASKIVVVNADGNQVPSQILFKGTDKAQSLIFPVSLKAGKVAKFTVKEGTSDSVAPKTYVRFVPERKDDIAWENDRIAFRMYGPALAAEYPSNGVDVWFKRTSNLIINKWYKNDLAHIASYHNDNGEGLDCYKVGHTLGAGGIAPYIGDSLLVGNHYDRYKILDNGPLQSSFILYYDKFKVGTHTIKAKMQITLNAFTNLNEAEVEFDGDTTGYKLAAGICLHDTVQSISSSVQKGYIAYAENLYSETNGTPSGRGYTCVIFPAGVSAIKQVAGHIIGISNYNNGDVYRYFFGAGWSKSGFKSDQDWFRYVSNQREAVSEPLEVKIYR